MTINAITQGTIKVSSLDMSLKGNFVAGKPFDGFLVLKNGDIFNMGLIELTIDYYTYLFSIEKKTFVWEGTAKQSLYYLTDYYIEVQVTGIFNSLIQICPSLINLTEFDLTNEIFVNDLDLRILRKIAKENALYCTVINGVPYLHDETGFVNLQSGGGLYVDKDNNYKNGLFTTPLTKVGQNIIKSCYFNLSNYHNRVTVEGVVF